MTFTKKDNFHYLLYFIIISLAYLSFLLVTPVMSRYRYHRAQRKYEIEFFTSTILPSIEKDEDKIILQSFYEIDNINKIMKLKEKTSWREKRKISHILQENDLKTTNAFGLYFYILLSLYFIRYFIALFYRDKKIDPNFEPTIAVIIPVKNEEKHIYETINRAVNTGYPLEKLEVIVINDGSTDNTLKEIKKAATQFSCVKYKTLKINQGKRMAITSGVKLTKAEYYVMLDSDTFLEKKSIRQIIQHFKDPKVAAISGHTKVQNLNENLLTKAQGFKYYISYRLFKSFESVFGTVVCAPGCFSAYRAKKFLAIMEEWHSKTLFGRKCVAGEDRSLTTLLLKKNKIKYSNSAVAYTIVPTKLKTFGIQQKRWMRSWFRESLYVACYMWKKNPLPAISFYAMLFISMFGPITLLRENIIMPIFFGISPLFYLYALLLIILTQSLFCILTGKFKFSIYGFIFSFLYFLFLVWIIPISIFTITSGNWGSREVNFNKKRSKIQKNNFNLH